jgi:rubrerythrin
MPWRPTEASIREAPHEPADRRKGPFVSTRPDIKQATLNDLHTAMQGEAFAYARYMLFAEAARDNGREELADLFESTARTEMLDHFARHAHLAGMIGSDADNLRAAIEDETYEIEARYPSFAEHARGAGDDEVANRFQEVCEDEIEHLEAFREALIALGE